jgi:hypothetical protein
MVTAFGGVNGVGLVKIRPEGMKLTSEYSTDQVVREIYQESRGSWRLGRLIHLTLCYDNAPVYQVSRVPERFRGCRFIRLVDPPESPDRAFCNFFL